MRRFVQLYDSLDETTRTTEKVAALERYFREAPAEDAAWALYFLAGNRVKRTVNTRLLREWIASESGLPPWLVDECHGTVGDLGETLALLHPNGATGTEEPLYRVAEDRIVALAEADEEGKRAIVLDSWRNLDPRQRFVWHKLISGTFRAGVARTLVIRAMARVAGVDQAVMAHRLSGRWEPTAETFARLLTGSEEFAQDPGQPYPFCLAHPLDQQAESLGEPAQWQVEWKWDGIRCQLIRRAGEILLWSRGEELITDRFPEIASAARSLPGDVVMDGEVLVWNHADDAPAPFASLQRRIGRRNAGPRILRELPALFMAYDLLEQGGEDLRPRGTEERRRLLEQVVQPGCDGKVLRLSPVVGAGSWEELAALRARSRERGVEGFMLKRRDAPYRAGRVRGEWWKWKVEPFTADCVMMYAQRGSGRRASLYTDYTFGVWRGDELVPVMKAYSGLTDREIARVDKWIRAHTVEAHGPVRVVEQALVFEMAFEGIQPSTRHKSGIAVRFPRIARWREDKHSREADTLEMLVGMMHGVGEAT